MNASVNKAPAACAASDRLHNVHCHIADEGTTQLVTVRYQMHGGPRQLSCEQHKHKDTRSYFIFIFEITQTQVLLIHWPKSQHTRYPSVFNSAWSKHTICFCFIPIIFTTCILDKVQVQLHGWRMCAVPPGCCWGIRWSPEPFLMVMEEPPRQPDWDRKLHSVARTGVWGRKWHI